MAQLSFLDEPGPDGDPRGASRGAPHDEAALRAKALAIHGRLAPVYGAPIPYFGDLDPLGELVSSFLNHRTRNADAHRAFEALTARFPAWEAVRDAPTSEVREAIAGVRWAEMKAARLQSILRGITERRGGVLNLDHLADMPVPEARRWLEALPGVGPKTSAATLAFSTLRRAALPVDSHHHRVAQRVGLIEPNIDVGPSHAILEAFVPGDWDAQAVYDHHELFMLHGQHVCHWRRPECGRCVLLDLCPEGQRREAGSPLHAAAGAGRLTS